MTTLLGVVDGVDDLLGVVLLGEGAGGAADDALAAGHTGYVAQGALKGAADVGVEAAVVGADDSHALVLGRRPRSGGT